MKIRYAVWIAAFLTFLNLHAPAATLYVSLNSTNPMPPYADWSTAATNIQDAVDAATNGDLILVTNGVYASGVVVVYGMSNRLAVTNPLTVMSVNGPNVTIILGYGPSGATAIRCVYLTNGAVLSGFTLTNGATQTSGDFYQQESGGGVWCESTIAVVTNCVITGNSAYFGGGGAYNGTLNNCTLAGNSAYNFGGGAIQATLNNCTLATNSAENGGGAYDCALNNCTLTNNSAPGQGGGAYEGTLNNCTLKGNSRSEQGGGAYYAMLTNCTLTSNSASDGGGAFQCLLNNCTLTSNSATNSGGGACQGYLNNCTLTGNSAQYGGGAYYATLNNCTLTSNSVSYSVLGGHGGGAYQGTQIGRAHV